VPGGAYDDSALDTGGGLRPELTGKGLGRQAIQAGLAYGVARFSPPAFRVTVAAFSLRALRVIQDLGFSEVGRFKATTSDRRLVVLVRAVSERRQGPEASSYRFQPDSGNWPVA
jgi:[ribosomal protein S18]-alanine N-acetyltransferase